jgi:carbon-monoxide dehydrogenase small subunit
MIRLTVNGRTVTVDPMGPESLLFTLRERLGLRGTKGACEQGECGSCTVLLDGDPVCSCLVMTADADDREILTVEGMAAPGDPLHPVQQAMLAHGGVQCGFCTPGFIVAAAHLLRHDPLPSEDDIREALAGNVCRCTGYGAILRAVSSLRGEP